VSGFRPVDPRQSFPELERAVLERWRRDDVFARQLAQRREAGAPVWSFYEGPPTANGKPGSHHVLPRVFKDVYPRYRAMRGSYVPRKAGWDCHGLPVELEVEKELGISSKAEIEDYGIAEFNARCRESVFRYVADWNRLTERIGCWLDLDDPYVTMTNEYIESVWWSLRTIWDQGRLYEGHKVVPYCPRCGTALSSHEVAVGYREVEDPSVFVRFPVTDPAGGLEVGDSLLAWTTTPWTLISNAALAVGPGIEYARVRHGDEVLVLAAELVERVLGDGVEELGRMRGVDLAGAGYSPPFEYVTGFGPRGHTVLEGDFVSTDDGTGIVHTAIAFGEDDFRLGERYGLELQNPVRADGTFDDRVADYAGTFVKDADPEIVAALRRSGRLLRADVYAHSYPHCWRCGTALLYYAKSSWYIRTTAVRDRMLAENEAIGWHPEHVKHGRFGRWLEGNVDWALSRERYWGTPLPVWECTSDDCRASFCAGSIADLRERGAEVPADLHRPFIDTVTLPCESCGGEMRRVEEVIDTWYDSGAMPFAQFHYPFEGEREFEQRFPADYICEAQDQTRGWFYSLLAESTLLFDRSSYRHCVCLGLILDAEGQKMSKSRGNVVDPWEVIDRHGADAFRWYYLTSQQPWSGYRFSIETVGEAVRQFMLTLWNTYSFWVLYANAEGLSAADLDRAAPEASGQVDDALDRWALSRLQGVKATVIEELDRFDCTSAGRRIAAYVEELSNWYVRLNRRRFWNGDRAAFATLRRCLIEVARLLAPFTPFVADEIHANLLHGDTESDDSVHLRDFPEPEPTLSDPDLEAGVGAALRAIELGRTARAAAKVKNRQPLRRAVIVATESERAQIERLGGIVAAELNVKELDFVSDQAELVTHEVKPNYRTLGPRFGKLMPQAAAAVAALDPDHAAEAIRGERTIGINLDGGDHTLEPQDLTLVMQPLAGYEVESEAGRAVALALELDDELRREGLAREIVHAVQNARKQAGLDVSDRIVLSLDGDPELLTAAREHEAYVAGETLATSVAYGGDGGTAATIDGRDLLVAVSRAG